MTTDEHRAPPGYIGLGALQHRVSVGRSAPCPCLCLCLLRDFDPRRGKARPEKGSVYARPGHVSATVKLPHRPQPAHPKAVASHRTPKLRDRCSSVVIGVDRWFFFRGPFLAALEREPAQSGRWPETSPRVPHRGARPAAGAHPDSAAACGRSVCASAGRLVAAWLQTSGLVEDQRCVDEVLGDQVDARVAVHFNRGAHRGAALRCGASGAGAAARWSRTCHPARGATRPRRRCGRCADRQPPPAA